MATLRLCRLWSASLRFLMATALAALFALAASGAAAQSVPELSRRVTDTAGLLNDAQVSQLETRLADFEQRKGAQITVLIIASVSPASIEDYALRTFEQWKLGRQGIDDGILVLVAAQDRQMRIEVGTGLEGAVPDVMAGRIIRERMAPAFRNGDYHAGIDDAISALMAVVDGEPLPEPQKPAAPDRVDTWAALLSLGMAVLAGMASASRRVSWKLWLPLTVLPATIYVLATGRSPGMILALAMPNIFIWGMGFSLWRYALARKILGGIALVVAGLVLLGRWVPFDTIMLGIGVAIAGAFALGLLVFLGYSVYARWKESRRGFAVRLAIWLAIPLMIGTQTDWHPIPMAIAAAIGALFLYAAGKTGSGSGGSDSGSDSSSSSSSSSSSFSGGGGSSRGGGASGSW